VTRDVPRNPAARWLWWSLAVLIADRATKVAVERYTDPSWHRQILSDFLVLVHSRNPGIAFGIFSGSSSAWIPPMLLASSAALIGLLVWMLLARRVEPGMAQFGIALIIGGAAGNALDRLLYGRVTDFIEVGVGVYRWPAFNVADAAISVGAALVLIDLFFGKMPRPDSTRPVR